MAYIDIIPEIYIRFSENWMAGVGFDWRKSTNPNYDDQILNFNLVRRFGRTQYIGHVNYEFENRDLQFGLKLNILF